MAATLEHERLQSRKARLIKQNEMHRRALRADLDELRGAANWLEQGFAFYRAAGRIRKWTAPRGSSEKTKPSSLAKLFRGCVLGFRLWKNVG